jgi:hypothetical protein
VLWVNTGLFDNTLKAWFKHSFISSIALWTSLCSSHSSSGESDDHNIIVTFCTTLSAIEVTLDKVAVERV